MDKRIIKTRIAIYNAVFDLSTEKPVDKISVVELCERAGINKSTFYLHYKSIDECIKQCFDYFTNVILDLGKDISYQEFINHPDDAIGRVLDLVEQNQKYFEMFKNSVVYDCAISTLKKKIVNSICEKNNLTLENNYSEIARLTFICGGCADIVLSLMPNFDRTKIEQTILALLRV